MATDSLIHIYRGPPQVGDTALCGHLRADEMEGHRLHKSSNQCLVCREIAEGDDLMLVERSALDPPGRWRPA